MTTDTLTSPAVPSDPGLPRAHRVTFHRVLHAEWIKFWSVRSTVWTTGAAAVVMAAVSWLAVFFTAREAADPDTRPQDAAVLTAMLHDPSIILTGTELAKLVVAVLGVLVVTSEYSTGTVHATMAAVPRRTPVLWAKALVLVLVVAATTVVGEVLSWAVALPTLSGQDATLDLASAETQRILGGGVLYLAGVSVLAYAIGSIARVPAGALAVVLGLLLVVEVMFRTMPADFFRTVSPFLPATAGHQLLATQDSIEQARATTSAPVLDPWVGFAVMTAWIAVALAVAAVQLRRRDA